MARKSIKKAKKGQFNVALAGTGAYAIAVAAGIHRRHGVKPDGKKAQNRKACRGKVRW